MLRANAELSPDGRSATDLVAAPRNDMLVLGAHAAAGAIMGSGREAQPPPSPLRKVLHSGAGVGNPYELPLELPRRGEVERMARLSVLHDGEDLLRVGWVVVCGRIRVGDETARVLQPLLSRGITLHRRQAIDRVIAVSDYNFAATGPLRVLAEGEAEVNERVIDPDDRAQLLDTAEFGGGGLQMRGVDERLVSRMTALSGWIRRCAAAAGLPVDRILGPKEDPWEHVGQQGLVAIPTLVVYLQRQIHQPSVRNALLNWAGRPGLGNTAMGALLDHGRDEGPPEPADHSELRSPLPLTPSQRAVVRRARRERVSVVSGSPGSGKTHAVAAVAMDAVARGEGVLVATRSRHAADVVTDQLRRTPGPEPVRFGDGAGMVALIDELGRRLAHPVDRSELARLDAELSQAELRVDALRHTIAERLELEHAAARAADWDDMVPLLQRDVPAVFDPAIDLDEVADLLERDATGTGLREWLRRRRRRGRLVELGLDTVDAARAEVALTAARSRRAAAVLASSELTDLAPLWERLATAEADARSAFGARIRALPLDAAVPHRHGQAALSQLLTALRSGRGRRRELLAELSADQLTGPAPLWVGTLSDIEDVLPATAGLFDLVILDEASQIDQARAAPALLRGRRAVVVGDPHQLRHVSFVSDRNADEVLAAHGLAKWRALLDPRRVSAFDLAAAIAPVDELREHFRSVPHLIEFAAERFYGGRVDVMTRHPSNDRSDAIDTVTVEAGPDTDGIQANEVDAVFDLLDALAAAGEHDVGIVSPFRSQADAIESRLVEQRTLEQIENLSLRVGTVHEFQGSERDVVIVSLGLHPDGPAGRRRFAEQPDLFNVMTTRARRKVIVVTSLRPTGDGLIDDYLRHAEAPPEPPPALGAAAGDSWTQELAEGLRRAGVLVRQGYPVGPWVLELTVGDGSTCCALESRVDPGGAAVHIERHLTLRALGWQLRDAYPSAFGGDPARAVVELSGG